MRFLYGLIAGILATSIGTILYLSLAGGEILLRLSPDYVEIKSRVVTLERDDRAREDLARRFSDLEARFSRLAERFSGLGDAAPAPGTDASDLGEPAPSEALDPEEP